MPFITEYRQSDTLVIAATGFTNKLSLPVDVFFREAGLSEMSSIVISDPSKRKMLGGLSPEFPSFFDCLDHLRREIACLSPKKLLLLGSSGGAHTALLLGHLLEANYVVGFAPYPYLSIREISRRNDPVSGSMPRVVEALDNLSGDVKKYFDLRKPLAEWNGKTRYYVHVSRYNRWDYRRALYLEGLPHLDIVAHPYSLHSTASSLCRDGRLKDCFQFPYKRTVTLKDLVLPAVELKSRFSKKIRRIAATVSGQG
ncbi:hypothetical protein [Prosthecochloris sp. GSB1]|uniref:hypothetical protein n=1 Tax=Prosthecochloris sp. GSB1 TaxID=281093 RepID=UPI0012373B94|nr:hypothetical protein [Prosthecochloris sp. GSB1]